ncbi:hypothetical protein EUZ85_05970 [Hahella sp. KA22]|nr:hypothetical protein ENC22_03420 [Hahella sp. KA22]QAY53658.1 hypothetical protein EUZ85_05970 [Hahella sp. KA22]
MQALSLQTNRRKLFVCRINSAKTPIAGRGQVCRFAALSETGYFRFRQCGGVRRRSVELRRNKEKKEEFSFADSRKDP